MPAPRATAFAPGSIGNVGPGFDVLGLAVGGIGDTVTVELTKDAPRVDAITGRDAELVPLDAARNCAAIAAQAILHGSGWNAIVTIHKGLALSGGMGGSAASSVAGAYAAYLALGTIGDMGPMGQMGPMGSSAPTDDRPLTTDHTSIISAALAGESAVAGRHLDNIGPSVLGGLALSRSVDPIDVIRLPVLAEWWVALVTPNVRVRTKDARALLPMECDRQTWIQLMANTTAMAHAFATGDGPLLRRAMDDRYAEPRRASLIPHFYDVKNAALGAGAYGSSISGSGPTIFAIAEDERSAQRCAEAMQRAFADIESVAHVGPIEKEGVRAV
ncbi:MAG TPA: homoserine kinase [Thermoanaerobaculia bacterium]|jgi:homoserine kinase